MMNQIVDPKLAQAILEADTRIRPVAIETPICAWPQLAERIGGQVWVKQENLQNTGSFKIRGATNAVLQLPPGLRGIVAASSGNHGAGVAFALNQLDQKGIIFVPENVAPAKLANIRRTGQEVRFFGNDVVETEVHARNWASSEGWHYLSPYNDFNVVAGQGTIGVELMRQLDKIDYVYVAVGGGGLISGVAAAIKAVLPSIKIVGCSATNSCVMQQSVKAGRILELASKPTLSDGTAGGIDRSSITFDYCSQLVDEWIDVNEAEIANALCSHIDECRQLVEAAAAVGFAGMIKHATDNQPNTNVHRVVISCGANIGSERLRDVLNANH